jgi:hypothetical protein
MGEISESRSSKSTPKKLASLSNNSTPKVVKTDRKDPVVAQSMTNTSDQKNVKPVAKKKRNRFKKTKLQLRYEDSDNAIKLTSNTLQQALGKFKNPIKQARKHMEEDGEDFDKIFGVKDFARFKESDDEGEIQTSMTEDDDVKTPANLKQQKLKVRRKLFKKGQ